MKPVPPNPPDKPLSEMSFHEMCFINEQKTCDHPDGCNRFRHRISRLCQPHAFRRMIWGDCRYYAIHRNEYSEEREVMKKLILLNVDHPGIAGGIRFFDNWFKLAASEHGASHVVGPEYVRHLYGKVTGVHALTEMAACTLYSERWRGVKVYGIENQLRFMANRLIRLKPFITERRYIKGSVLKAVGHNVWSSQEKLLTNMASAAEKSLVIHEEEATGQELPLTLS